MLSATIKERTLVKHQELEKKMVGRMRAMQGIPDYITLLQLFYSYFGGLEKLIDPFINAHLLADHTRRRKADLLAADLHTLGADIPATTDHLPTITNAAEALGALYVMEGSTLGGQFIKKMISKQMGIDENYALSFFNGYGKDTHEMWATFQQAMNEYSSPETDELVINSANQTFQKFGDRFEINNGSVITLTI